MTSSQEEMKRYVERVLAMMQTDAQLAAIPPKPELIALIEDDDIAYDQMIARILDGYGERQALGVRDYDIVYSEAAGQNLRHYLPSFSTITYSQLHQQVKALAQAWLSQDQLGVKPGDFVCILGFNSLEYTVLDLAVAYVQGVSVPLQGSLAGTDLDGIFNDTCPTALATTVEDLPVAANLALAHDSIRSIIVMDYDARDDSDKQRYDAALAQLQAAESAVQLTSVKALLALGDANSWEFLPAHPDGLERMSWLIHSSGSTGTPKGAIIPDRISKYTWISRAPVPTVRVAFAPFNHFMGRFMVFRALTSGGTCYFTVKPDMSTLFEDIRIVRPTDLNAFPRVLELIYQHYQSEVVRRVSAGKETEDQASHSVMAQMASSFLGDRLCMVSTGSAPSSAEVKQFMRDCFGLTMVEGYGSTEVGGVGVTMDDRICRPPVIDYKLRDVPELGYFSTDKPYPRGELCVKTTMDIPGYFKRPEATAKIFDEDGYVCTDDIMEERGPDHLVLIDRRNDVLKLSQGEYVAVGPLGTVFESGSALIHQIHIYGNSARSYLLAVVVPELSAISEQLGASPSEAQLRSIIRGELQRVTRDASLKSFEMPRDFILEMEPFSHENGLLSSVRKRMRPNIQRKYGEALEQLYVDLERKQRDDLLALKDPNSTLTVLEKIGKALEASLGIQDIDVNTTLGFEELGGDSLGATSFALLLEDIFGVAVPINNILSPVANPKRWATEIELALSDDGQGRPSFASIHGKDATVLKTDDLALAHFIDAQTLDNVANIAAPSDTINTVLLTGANGYLGRFMCMTWLERMAAQGQGKLICLIRGTSVEAARKRLDSVFEGVDPALEQRFQALAAQHLEVLIGEVADPDLGLSKAEFERLAAEVDHISHPAALVNHMLQYAHLFGPNVVGTAELIRLAFTTKMKRIDFVSTVGVLRCVDMSNGVNEDSPLLRELNLSDDYAFGYGASKWAGEALLHKANEAYGLPVRIFRGDMMLAHTHYKGQINVPDMFTRFLYSTVVTGLAPVSFYELAADGSRQPAHYDGLPVDFVAGAMVGIGAQNYSGISTYHVVNHHAQDGISLDSFVDWIASAGYSITRLAPFDNWFTRFEEKLRSLPEEQRQHSSLAILGSMNEAKPVHDAMMGSEHFQAAVNDLPIGPDVPNLSEEFIHKYLNDMRLLGLIGEPS